MTVLESYPIHRCIYRNNATALQELLDDEEFQKRINEYDNHGNTPLHLALMLNRHNCIIVLLKYDCDVFSRNNFGWNPINEASMLGDIDVISRISYRRWKEYVDALVEPNGFLDEWNKTTPNLYLKIKVKIKPTIPLLKKFGAKDVHKLYKKGKNIRFDTTIGGIDVHGIPKIIRKNMSILFLYEESEGINKIYLIDHKNKRYQEFFPNVPDWVLTNFLNSKIGANTICKFTTDLTRYYFKTVKGGLMKKTTRTFTMENGKSYKCDHCKGKNLAFSVRKRNDQGLIGTCESIINYEGEDEKSKKTKEGKNQIFNKRHNSIATTTSKNSSKSNDDSSDEESSVSSDDESDFEDNSKIETRSNEDFIGGLYNDDFENGKSENRKTVTYTINRDGKTKTFEKTTSMEDTLDWEQAYHDKYAQNSDIFYTLVNGRRDRTKLKNLTFAEIEKLDLKKISEDEYFDPSNRNPLHLGRIMNLSEEKRRNNKLDLWMVKKDSHFPINALDIKPFLKFSMTVLLDQIKSSDNTCEIDKQAYKYITGEMLDNYYRRDIFPIKTSVPVFSSVAYQATFVNASKEPESVPDEVFKIPSDYTCGNVYFEHHK